MFQHLSPPLLPFLSNYKTPLALYYISPHFFHTMSHWAEILVGKDLSAENPMQNLHLDYRVLSWNSLGEQKKTLVTFHVYFWHLINGFEVLKIPAFSFTRRNRTTLPKPQLSSARHDLNKKLSKLAKIIEILWLTSQLIPALLGGDGWDASQFLWNNLKVNTQLK